MGIENIRIDDVIGVLTNEPQSSKEILEKLGIPQDARKFGKWMKPYRHMVRTIKLGDRYKYALKGSGPDVTKQQPERKPAVLQQTQEQKALQPSEYDYLRKLEGLGISLEHTAFDILIQNATKWKAERDQLQRENERLERLLRVAENELEDMKEQKEKEGRHQLFNDIQQERKVRAEMF